METNDTNDISFADAVGTGVLTDSEATLLLSLEELAEEIGDDPTVQVPDDLRLPAVKGKRGPKLTPQQQMQIAVWQVEGIKFKAACSMMLALWGFTITQRSWRYYQTFRKDLHRDAAGYLETQYLNQGFASHAVRVRRLGKLIDRLGDYIEEHGFEEHDEHLSGYAKGAQTVKTVKFAHSLSKEYREALDLMKKWTHPAEIKAKELRGPVPSEVDAETATQFQLAAGWTPQERD